MVLTVYAILYFLCLVFSGYGLGCICLKKLNTGRSRWLEFLVNSSVGLGFLSLIHFVFACAKGFAKPFVYILAGIIFLSAGFGIYTAFAKAKKFFDQKPEKIKRPYNFMGMVMLTVMTVGLVFVFICALTPSVSDDWDSLAYHLSAPKLFLQHGGFYYINYSSHTNFPMLQEILYVTPILFNIPVAGKLLHFFFGIMTMLLTGYIISGHFNKQKDRYSTVWGPFMVFSMPIFLWLMTTAYIDITVAFYGLLALYFALEYSDRKDVKDLILLGFACGFAASCKMLGCQFILLFALWIILDNVIKNKSVFKNVSKHILIFLFPSLLVCLPWYIKTLIFTGNPVYPFFYEIFGGRDWTQSLADFYAFNQAKFGVGHTFRSFIITPVIMTMAPGKFYDVPGLYIGAVLAVVFPAVCLLLQVRKKKLLLTATVILLQYVIWFALTHQSRYLIPMFVMGCVFVPGILTYIIKGDLVKYSLMIIFVLISFVGLLQMYNTALVRLSAVTGEISRDAYLLRYMKTYEAHKYINEHIGGDVKIGLFGDTEGFYLDKPYMWCDYGHNNCLTHNYKSGQELADDLVKNGVTHIVVPFGKNPPTVGDRELATGTYKYLFEAIDQGLFEAVYPENMSYGRVFVFRIIKSPKF